MIDIAFNWADRTVLRKPERRLAVAARLSPAILQALQRAKFKRLVRYVARHSKFYRDAFQRLGIDPRRVRSHADLGDFFTTADDLRRHPIEDFICARPEFGFETTGTSKGVNKRVYFSYREMADYGRDGAAGLYNLGITRDDVIADGFDYSFWNAPFTAYYTIQSLGAFHIVGAFVEPAEFYERVSPYRPTVLMGVPTHMVRVTEVAEKQGIWPVRIILLGGENLSERTRRYIESVWKGARVYLGYGQTEAFGANGIECPDRGGYHISFSTIADIDGADEEGYGELVYSTLNRSVMPLVRYRSADITRWADDGACRCALRSLPRVAKIIGRSDELINCSMGNISPYWFDEILRDIPEVTDDWQVVVRRGERDDRIEFHIEVKNGGEHAAIQRQVFQNIQERFPDCWRYYQKRFFEFDFQFHPARSLGGGRKLRRLIDARTRSWDE